MKKLLNCQGARFLQPPQLLTLALALVAMVVVTGLGVAQQKGEERGRPTGAVEKQPATGEKAVGKASPKPMTGELTGKVAGVDPTAKTFTVMVQGRAVTFSAAKLSKLPTVGENIDIAFTANPGQLPMATSSTESGSNARKPKKPYQHCDDHTHGQNPLNSLNVCTY
jgi:hypothetical protein